MIDINVGIPAPTASIPPLYAAIAATYFPTAAPILI